MTQYMTRPVDDSDLYVGPPEEPNRYRIGNTVGKGGEGEVVHAYIHSAGTWQPVAVKVWRNPAADDPGFEARVQEWRTQLNLVQFLHHPGIVGMREVFVGIPPHRFDQTDRVGQALYLVMNWAPGESLATWVVSNPNPGYGRIHSIVLAVAAGLSHMHSGVDTNGHPIVHGDLKPGNVMVDESLHVKIVDFGLAQGVGGPDNRGRTPGYSAPEVTAGGPPSVAADIFALGGIAYFLLAGANPPARYDAALIRATLLASPVVGHQPALVDHLCMAMAENPNDRPSDAATWAAGLASTGFTTLNGAPGPSVPSTVAAATPDPTSTQPWWVDPTVAASQSRRNRLVISLAVALLAIALVASLLWWRGQNGAEDEVAASGTSTTEAPGTTAEPTTTESTRRPTTTTTSRPTTTTARSTTSTSPPSTTTTEPPSTTVAGPTVAASLALLEPVDGRVNTKPATMDGVEYTDVVRMNRHPWSTYTAEYNLNAQYARISGTMGSTDTANAKYRWEMRISAIENGQERILAQAFLNAGEHTAFDVDVTGVRRFVLSVRLADKSPISAGPSTDYPSIWANPVLTPA